MKSVISKYFLLSPLLLLYACAGPRDAGKTLSDLPAQYRFATASQDDSSTIADIPWRSFFTDPALLQLIDTAILNNYDMQLALKNMEIADLSLRQARWNYVPELRLQISAGSNRPSDNSLSGISAAQFLGTTHIEDFNAAVALSWEADIWGKMRNQKRSAQAAFLQTAEARKLIQTGLISRIADGYYNLLMLDAQLYAARQNLLLSDSTLEIIRLQFSSGQVSSLAAEQAEAQQLAAAGLIPKLEKSIALQEHALYVLSGAYPGTIARTTQLSSLTIVPGQPSGIPAQLLSRRPDVRSAELGVRIATARSGIAQAAMYPSLSITAAGGINSFKASNWFTLPASLFGQAAGNMLQPLISRRQLHTQYRIALAEKEKSVLQFRQTVLNAVGEVSDALISLDKLAEQYRIAANRMQRLEQATTNAGLLFEHGMANYLEVLTAQGNVLQSALEIAAIRKEQLSASVTLYRALGGGWK